MSPGKTNKIEVEPKFLTGIDDTIQFISKVCSLYFHVDEKIINRILVESYHEELKEFISEDNKLLPLIIHFKRKEKNDLAKVGRTFYNMLVIHTLEEEFSIDGEYIALYKCYSKQELPEYSKKEWKTSSKNTFEKFVLIPLFFNNDFPLMSTVPSYINNLLVPILNHESQKGDGKDRDSPKWNHVMMKLKEISEIIGRESNDDLDLCDSIRSFVNFKTNVLEEFKVKIEDEFILEDIKSKVREWSVDISEAIREYMCKFSEEYEDESLSISESEEEYDSEMTSGSTSDSEENSFDFSFLSLKTTKVKRMDTKIVNDISEYVELICSERIDAEEEIKFWKEYWNKIINLVKKVESPNFVNTLLLLEYNNVSVDNIYSFDESIKIMKQIREEVKEINSMLEGLGLGNLIECKTMSDLNVIIDNTFNDMRKHKNIKYMKNERFIRLFEGIVGQIINSISRIISIELKRSNMENNQKVLIKSVKVGHDLKSKMFNLDKYLEKNKIRVCPPESKLIILLDLYKDVLESVLKCNDKFLKLQEDGNSIRANLSDELEIYEEADQCHIGGHSKWSEFYKNLNEIIMSVIGSNDKFISKIIENYSKISEDIANIIELDELTIITKKEIDERESVFMKWIDECFQKLDLFEAVPILKTINLLKTTRKENLISYNIDTYVDQILEEYDKLTNEMKSLDNEFYHPINEYSNRLVSEMDLKERILNLLDITEVMMKVSNKMIVKKTNQQLTELLEERFDFSIEEEYERLIQEISLYKEEIKGFKVRHERFQDVLSYEVSVPKKKVMEELDKIKNCVVKKDLNELELESDVKLIEGLYNDYMYINEEVCYSEHNLTKLIRDDLGIRVGKGTTIGCLLRAYKEKKEKIEKFFENERNLKKLNKYFEETKLKWEGINIEYENKSVEFSKDNEIEVFNFYEMINYKSMVSLIQEDLTKIKIIKSSNCNEKVLKDSLEWMETLYKAKEYIYAFNSFNTKFVKLVKILSSKSINLGDCVKELYSLEGDINKISTVTRVLLIDSQCKGVIDSMMERVDKVERILSKYLNEVRYSCPRMYFLKDSDLLEIIGGGQIQGYLTKIFSGIYKFLDRQGKIFGTISREGEVINFVEPIKYESEKNINFINELDLSIKKSLKESFVKSLNQFRSVYRTKKLDEGWLIKWISMFPVQILVLTISLCWTESMESCNSDSDLKELENFILTVIKIVLFTAHSKKDFEKLKMIQLFLTLNYHLRKTREVGLDVRTSLKWMKCVRYYYEKEVVKVKIMTKEYSYSFEYMFNVQKMISTSLTEHFYIFASMAIKSNYMVCSQGPAGTGKTETIKSLSYLTGSNMLVFNMSELYEIEDMEQILSGLCILGYWGILDEFNRLNECVLSSVTENMKKISNKKLSKITLLEKEIKIEDNTNCFITMNPGYTGRKDLPSNCLDMCQQFAMEKIDLAEIIKVNLELNRVKESLQMTSKMMFFLEIFSLIFRGIKYDFGLRFVKQVLRFFEFIYNDSKNVNSHEKSGQETILFQCLKDSLYPRLTEDEITLYKYILPNEDKRVYSTSEGDFMKVLNGLVVRNYIKNKAFQIFQMSVISSFIILYGESKTGKSQSLKTFIECMKRNKEVKVEIFDPNSMDLNQLYGYKLEDKWLEGLIPYLLKKYKDKETYIVFDGDMNQEWVENLNSLMDDNRVLTLSNGERIPLSDKIRIIFETDSLENITPATISRCTLVQFEQNKDINKTKEDNRNGCDHMGTDEKIKFMINESKAFLIQCSEEFGIKEYVEQLADGFSVQGIYLCQGMNSSEFINYLFSILELDEKWNMMKPKSGRNQIILIKDVNLLRESKSLESILRQIVDYKYFYIYNKKKMKWDKIVIEGIELIFVQPERKTKNDRLLNRLEIIKIKDTSTKIKSQIESGQLKDFEILFEKIQDTFFLKSKSIIEAMRLIYLTLKLNNNFIVIKGPCVSGKKFLSNLASKMNGLELSDLSNKTKEDTLEYIISCGLGKGTNVFYLNTDRMLSTGNNIYYIIKNMIFKEYFVIFDETRMKDIQSKNGNQRPLQHFTKEFHKNLDNNVRFILSGKNIEESVIKRSQLIEIEELSYEELKSVPMNIREDHIENKIIGEIYLKARELIGDKFSEFVYMVKMTKKWYGIFKQNNENIMKHLSQGVQKIESFKQEIDKLETSLNITKDRLNQMNSESEIKIRLLEEKKRECEEKRKVSIRLTKTLKERNHSMDNKKEEINREIENVKPMIEKAKDEVKNINRKAMDELKTMNNPPFIVKYAIETVSMLIQNSRNAQWEEAKKFLKSPDFIPKIIEYKVENMTDQSYTALKERLSIPEWDTLRISKASKAAGPLAKWADSILQCYEIYKQVIPLKREIQEIEDENIENERVLEKQKILIKQVEDEIERNRLDYNKKVEESKKIVKEIEKTESKLSVSRRIIEDFTKELVRWNVKIEEIGKDKKCLFGNSLIESTIPVYISLDCSKRKTFAKACKKIIERHSILCSVDIEKMSNIESHSIENNKRCRHVLILDSKESEYRFLIGEQCTVVSACDEDFTGVLEGVKSMSGNLVITDFHFCSVNVKNTILNEFKQKIDVERDFTIYLLSTTEYFKGNGESENHLIESIYNRALVLNMNMDSEYFIEFTKKKIIEVMEPEVNSVYVNSNKELSILKTRVNKNENSLLEKLISSDIFDPNFIEFIEEYNRTTMELESEMMGLNKSAEKYFECLESKMELTQLIFQIYLEIKKLSKLNKMYYFDFNILFYLAKEFRNNENIYRDLIVCSYNWIERGLFPRDKLFWSINMLRLLSKYDSDLSGHEYVTEDNCNIESQKGIKEIISSKLKKEDFDKIIMSFYDTIVLITETFQDKVHIARSISESEGKKLDMYAVGSVSEMEKVIGSIKNSLELGNNVILKNIHLSKGWINKIETEFVKKQRGTKLFLTCDSKVELSNKMLISCLKITEETSSLNELVVHLFNTFNSILNWPKHLEFILLRCVLIHSIVVVRQSYVPYGWTNNYNFSTNNFKMAVEIIKELSQVRKDHPSKDLELDAMEIIRDIYSSKISNEIDLKTLEDIIKLSSAKVPVEEQLDFERWVSNNLMEDDLKFIGLTLHAQKEMFDINRGGRIQRPEYDTSGMDPEYRIPCKCKILKKLYSKEVNSLRSEGTSYINPDEHQRNFDSIVRFIEGESGVTIDFNHVVFPTRLIKLIKFPICRRINTDPSETELRVTLGAGSNDQKEVSFRTRAVLYNGTYDREANSITAGEGEEVHTLEFEWIWRKVGPSIRGKSVVYVPLYNARGFVKF